MNKFIRDIIPLLFLMLIYIILFLDQKNNPYNRILKLDLNKSKNTFSSNNTKLITTSTEEKEEEERQLLEKKEEEKRIKALQEIKISPTWVRFTKIT